jgi:hypothetical protein
VELMGTTILVVWAMEWTVFLASLSSTLVSAMEHASN